MIRKAGEQETQFKFHRTVKLEPGAITTVWSADVGAEHEPPLNIVMKGQKWFVADTFTTQLLNTDQEVSVFSKPLIFLCQQFHLLFYLRGMWPL